jgi:molecular chaperone HscB
MVQCPSCGRAQDARLLCSECGSPIPANLDLFAALGLPRKLIIDFRALEANYHDISRRIHPDRFAAKPAKVRDASVRATALVTRAFRTLRDPVSRGLYWLELNGHKLAENNKQVPPDLAELVFEVQEQLAELKSVDGGSPEVRADVIVRQAALRGLIDALQAELLQNFGRFDAADEQSDAQFTELKAILSKLAYLRTLLRDVEKGLDTNRAA